VGKAANHAAKLTALKVKGKTTWISPDVYDELPDWLKQSKLGASMWDRYNWNAMGGVPIMGSSYYQPF
jgi:class 3 adenylate cyclase